MTFGLSYSLQIWLFRAASIVAPLAAAYIAYRTCLALQAGERVERERRRAAETARAEGRAAARQPSPR